MGCCQSWSTRAFVENARRREPRFELLGQNGCQHLESSDEPAVLVDQEPTEEEEGVKLKSNCGRSHSTLSLLAGRSYWRRYICANIVINPLITRDPMVASIVFSCLPSLSHWLIW